MKESSAHVDSLPERIGRFAIRGKLGEGAMSTVYEGYDERSDRGVAIKLLEGVSPRDEDGLRRIEREVGALERIHHPGVARLLEFGRDPDGRPFLVIELIQGPTLREIIEQRRAIDPLTGVEWMIQAAEALEEMWKHHIIHRDLKPGNLIIDGDGRLKILDLGLAKALHQDLSITTENVVLGTPRYMPPEAGLGQSQDFRADMYSLGATFYHLFLRQSPFDADSPVAMMMKHANAPLPPPHSIDPALPDDVDVILTRLLAKEPSRRYESYADLIADLRDARLALLARDRARRGETEDDPLLGDPSVLDPRLGVGPLPGPSEAHPKSVPLTEEERRARAAALEVVKAKPGRETRGRLAVVLALLVFGLAAAISIRFPSSSPASGEARQQSWLGERLAALPLLRPRANPQREAERLASMTKERMQAVMSSIIRYEAAQGSLPPSLAILERQGWVDGRSPVDAWGNRMRFHRLTRTLRSVGSDGAPETGDDFVLDSSMRFTTEPAPYSPSP